MLILSDHPPVFKQLRQGWTIAVPKWWCWGSGRVMMMMMMIMNDYEWLWMIMNDGWWMMMVVFLSLRPIRVLFKPLQMKIWPFCNININHHRSEAIRLVQNGFKDDIHQARAKKAHDQQKILEDHVGDLGHVQVHFVFTVMSLSYPTLLWWYFRF